MAAGSRPSMALALTIPCDRQAALSAQRLGSLAPGSHGESSCSYPVHSTLCPTLCNPMDCSPPGSSVHGILRQEYWSGLPCPPLGGLPNPGIKPSYLKSPELAGGFFTTSTTCDAESVTKVPPAPTTLAVEVSPPALLLPSAVLSAFTLCSQ